MKKTILIFLSVFIAIIFGFYILDIKRIDLYRYEAEELQLPSNSLEESIQTDFSFDSSITNEEEIEYSVSHNSFDAGDRDSFSKVIDEVYSGNFKNILLFHSIVSFCDGIPRSLDERADWIALNASSASSDIGVLDNDMVICADVPRLSFDQKEEIYRNAIDQGAKQAEYALAQMIPYNTVEKIKFLRNASTWTSDASMLIAEIALRNQTEMTELERLFWITVSGIHNYVQDDQSNVFLNELTYSLNTDELDDLNNILRDWRSADKNKMKSVIVFLEKYKST